MQHNHYLNTCPNCGATDTCRCIGEKTKTSNPCHNCKNKNQSAKEITAKFIVEYLNSLVELDSEAVTELFNCRVICSPEMEKHPHLVVESAETFFAAHIFGSLGVINGMLEKSGQNRICAVYNDQDKITEFREL